MDNVLEQIKEITMKYKIEKVVLFGSRARGDNSLVSDYDVAVFENTLSDIEKASLSADIEEIDTLKKIDLVFVREGLKDELMSNILRDGVIIYEQISNKIK